VSKLSGLARYAWGVLAFNLIVILWGAYVRATGSGAGCGSHWPLCNGEVFPREPRLATLIEFTHRATSGIALLMVVGLYLWSRRAHPKGDVVRRGAALSLVFIVIEALLGAGLVLFELVADDASRLRAISMVAHLINTFILIGFITLTAWWASGGRGVRLVGSGWRGWALGAALGGLLLVGATGAIAALGDTLYPSPSLTEGLRDSFSSDSQPLIQLRKYHPFLAIFLGLYVVWLARRLASAGSRTVARLATLVTAVYGVQLLAGMVNLVLLAPVTLQLVHLALADLVWISLVLLGAATLGDDAGPTRATEATPGRSQLATR
jgi:heme A synthase